MDPNKEYLVQRHQIDGLSAREIARELGCSHTMIIKRMKKYGIQNTTESKYNQYGRKLSYNDNYFDNIDSEDKAYWFGFLYADGYISATKKQKKLRIALAEKDEDHLQVFIKSLNADIEIKHQAGSGYTKKTSSYVDINSTKLCDQLIEHGMIRGKQNRQFPEIKSSLVRHFIRGLLDADGSVLLRNGKILYVHFAGFENIILGVKKFLLENKIALTEKCIYRVGKIFCLRITSRENLLNLHDLLYDEATIYLDRKKNRFSW